MIAIKFPKLDTISDGCSNCPLWGTRLDGESICSALELLSYYDGEATSPYIDYYLDVGGKHKDCPLIEEKRNYRDMYNRLLAKYSALRVKYEPEEFKKSVIETMKGICDVLSEE